MNKIIDLRYLCLFLLVSIKFPSANCNILKDACLTDSNCDATGDSFIRLFLFFEII
jgi:hypothetical protein